MSPLAPLHEDLFVPELSLRTIEEQANDSGTETLQDTDSEPDDQQAKTEEIIEECTGWNVSVFYAFRFKIRVEPVSIHIHREQNCSGEIVQG